MVIGAVAAAAVMKLADQGPARLRQLERDLATSRNAEKRFTNKTSGEVRLAQEALDKTWAEARFAQEALDKTSAEARIMQETLNKMHKNDEMYRTRFHYNIKRKSNAFEQQRAARAAEIADLNRKHDSDTKRKSNALEQQRAAMAAERENLNRRQKNLAETRQLYEELQAELVSTGQVGRVVVSTVGTGPVVRDFSFLQTCLAFHMGQVGVLQLDPSGVRVDGVLLNRVRFERQDGDMLTLQYNNSVLGLGGDSTAKVATSPGPMGTVQLLTEALQRLQMCPDADLKKLQCIGALAMRADTFQTVMLIVEGLTPMGREVFNTFPAVDHFRPFPQKTGELAWTHVGVVELGGSLAEGVAAGGLQHLPGLFLFLAAAGSPARFPVGRPIKMC